MAEVIHHEHAASNSEGSGIGFMFGAVLLVIFLMMLLFYGLPFLRNTGQSSGPQINIPDKVDVNIQQP